MQFGDWLQYSPAVGNMQGGVSRCCRQICACSFRRPITVQHFFHVTCDVFVTSLLFLLQRTLNPQP